MLATNCAKAHYLFVKTKATKLILLLMYKTRGHFAKQKNQKINFLHQVAGERYVYKFVCEPEALISLAFPDSQRPGLKAEFERYVNEEDTVPLSHLDEAVQVGYPPAPPGGGEQQQQQQQAAPPLPPPPQNTMGSQQQPNYSKGYMY